MTTETTTPTPILTPEQIDGLEGRELDAAVAVWLFGWRWHQARYIGMSSCQESLREQGKLIFAPPALVEEGSNWRRDWTAEPTDAPETLAGEHLCPAYSTDPAAADLARVEMESRSLSLHEYNEWETAGTGRTYQCYVYRGRVENTLGTGASKTDPHIARCRAALKAAMQLAGEKEEGK